MPVIAVAAVELVAITVAVTLGILSRLEEFAALTIPGWIAAAVAMVLPVAAAALATAAIRRTSSLVLTVPSNVRGEKAIDHLRSRGLADLGCFYLESLVDRLDALDKSRDLVASHDYSFHLVSVRRGAEMLTANRILAWHDGETENRGHVVAAEPNARFTLSGIGAPFTIGGCHQDYWRQMRLDKKPSDVTGAGVRVAVIDSGFADRGDGGLSPFVAYDLQEAKPQPRMNLSDDDGHGTAMAELIHAVAPKAEIAIIRATDEDGMVTLWNLLAAIPIAAYDCGAHIINLSLGISDMPLECKLCGAKLETRLLAYEKMLELIAARSGEAPIYVAATGNDGCSTQFDFPAFEANTLAVGSLNKMGSRSSFSNYGTRNHRWHVMAPGGEKTAAGQIVEHVGTGSTGSLCYGTSPAAAYVSGMLALLRSEARYQSTPRDDFLDTIMRDHCEPSSGLDPIEYGSGQIVYVKEPISPIRSVESTTRDIPLAIEEGDGWVKIGGIMLPQWRPH